MATSLSLGGYVASENFAAAFGPRQKALAKRGVLIHGGRGQTCLSNLPPDRITNMLTEDLIPVGYADYSDGKTWGNDTGSTRVGQAWTYQKANWGAKTDKVCLYGASMGCLTLLRWALANVSSVACFVGLIPALSLVSLHDDNTVANAGLSASEIETAHGVSGTYAGNATITARDPLQNAASYTFPILLMYSGNDPVAVPAAVTSFAAAAPDVTLVNMGNLGHAASADLAYGDQLAGFLAAHA